MGWIILIIFLAIIFFWPQISAWLQRAAMRKAENMFRKAAGMPPRSKQRHDSRQHTEWNDFRNGNRRYRGKDSSHVIPPEYAEDVEFTEIRTYSDDPFPKENRETGIKQENQVSDAEWEELK